MPYYRIPNDDSPWFLENAGDAPRFLPADYVQIADAEAQTMLDALNPVPAAPSVVSMRQARLALMGAGLLAQVNEAVAVMTGAAGDAARVEWEYAASVDRNSPLVAGLAAALSITEAQLDALFTEAAAL